jgi:fluoride exporter
LTPLLVVAGAVLGAPLRYVVDLVVQSRHDSVFPWGTLLVNVLGSLLLGVVGGAVSGGAPTWLLTVAGTGFCGGLTTFSTFGLESVRLVEDGSWFEAFANVALSLVLGLVACTGGWVLAAATM